MSACGEALHGERCDIAEFEDCLSREVFPACRARCETGLECNLVRQGECLPDCIGGLLSSDPLTQHRSTELNRCVALADDCFQADRCFNPTDADPVPVDQASFCRLWDPCFGNMFACREVWQLFGGEEATVACAVRNLQQGCPRDPFFLLMECVEGGGGNVDNGCAGLCEAVDICDQLPEGQARQECFNDCNSALSGPNEAIADSQRRRNRCRTANSCPDLAECLASHEPEQACPRYCERLDACGQEPADCEPQCVTNFLTSRHTEWRDCVADAGDNCGRVTECAPPPAVGCDELCGRLRACGQESEDCLTACDEAQYEDFNAAMANLACVHSASTCDIGPNSVLACRLNRPAPQVPGLDAQCLAYCRTLHGCTPDTGSDMAQCLAECGEGWNGPAAWRFARGAGCAADVIACDQDGAACFPEAAPGLCDDWCDQLGGCDSAPAGCDENCDTLSQRRSQEQASCLEDARDACEEIRTCSTRDVPGLGEDDLGSIDHACHRLCITQAECGQIEGTIRECTGSCLRAMASGAPELEERQTALLTCRVLAVPRTHDML